VSHQSCRASFAPRIPLNKPQPDSDPLNASVDAPVAFSSVGPTVSADRNNLSRASSI